MSKSQYLQRLGHSWYVRVKVPAALQERVRNTHIRRALGTRDLDEAARRKWAAIAGIRAYLADLAADTGPANPLSCLSAAPCLGHSHPLLMGKNWAGSRPRRLRLYFKLKKPAHLAMGLAGTGGPVLAYEEGVLYLLTEDG